MRQGVIRTKLCWLLCFSCFNFFSIRFLGWNQMRIIATSAAHSIGKHTFTHTHNNKTSEFFLFSFDFVSFCREIKINFEILSTFFPLNKLAWFCRVKNAKNRNENKMHKTRIRKLVYEQKALDSIFFVLNVKAQNTRLIDSTMNQNTQKKYWSNAKWKMENHKRKLKLKQTKNGSISFSLLFFFF